MNKKGLSVAAILLAAILWGNIGLFIRYFNGIGVGSSAIVFSRASITTIAMFLFLFFTHRDLLKIKLKDIPVFIGTGIISFEFFNLCYMSSMGENSLSVACILMYTSPVWVSIISIPLFKDKLTGKKLLALILVLSGCALVSLTGSVSLTMKGLMFGLGSGIGYALYSIFGRIALNRGYHSFTITFYTFVFATLGLLPIVDYGQLSICFSSGKNTCLTIALAFLSTVFPYILYTTGLANVMPSVASMVSTVEPVTAAIVGAVFFSESLGILSILGIVIVLIAIAMLNFSRGKSSEVE